MALQNPHEIIYLTEEEHLKSKLISDFKREYIDGRIYAMAGAGYNHNRVDNADMNEFGQEKQKPI